ncbi:GGT1 [Bugula neritina]|uniref:GGT1 n=1 Tax=Bugula neritina TaxID=10212 RepID=A0A7J7JKJ7_BUGNE|nr:GGT1 [Bugula neritina]
MKLLNLTDPEYGAELRSRICDDTTHSIEYYGATTDSRKTTGTSQISVLAGNGDAVSLTTSINACWGSKRMGKRTGIIFNNHMDDFSMPGTPSWTDDAWVAPSNAANWIEPGKRPLSAMCPSIVTDSNEDVILVTGGSGGAQITTATALTIINYLWFGHNLLDSVSKPRLHNQLLPNTIFYEKGFPEEYLEELEKKKHKLTPISFPPVTESVCSHNGAIFGVGDFRRLGGADGF